MQPDPSETANCTVYQTYRLRALRCNDSLNYVSQQTIHRQIAGYMSKTCGCKTRQYNMEFEIYFWLFKHFIGLNSNKGEGLYLKSFRIAHYHRIDKLIYSLEF